MPASSHCVPLNPPPTNPPPLKTLLHTARITVRWGDMDALGHVNNAVYFQYFEQARIEAFEQAFTDGWLNDGMPILAATSAEFLRPIHAPAVALVRIYAGPPGTTSFPQFFELTLEGDEDTLYARGEARLVWVDRATGRPTKLPDALRATLPDPD